MQPTISINNVSQMEGNSGTTAFIFTVSLSNASYQTISVDFTTADGSATIADNDYQFSSGTLTFNPGETSKTITVLVNGDLTAEASENFFVNLSNALNASFFNWQAQGTIWNDDMMGP